MNGNETRGWEKAAFSAAPIELGRVVKLTVCLGQASRSIAAAGFAPRKAATTIYLVDGIGRYGAQLERLGPTQPASDASTSRISKRLISRCWRTSSPSHTALSPMARTCSVPAKEPRLRQPNEL